METTLQLVLEIKCPVCFKTALQPPYTPPAGLYPGPDAGAYPPSLGGPLPGDYFCPSGPYAAPLPGPYPQQVGPHPGTFPAHGRPLPPGLHPGAFPPGPHPSHKHVVGVPVSLLEVLLQHVCNQGTVVQFYHCFKFYSFLSKS